MSTFYALQSDGSYKSVECKIIDTKEVKGDSGKLNKYSLIEYTDASGNIVTGWIEAWKIRP